MTHLNATERNSPNYTALLKEAIGKAKGKQAAKYLYVAIHVEHWIERPTLKDVEKIYGKGILTRHSMPYLKLGGIRHDEQKDAMHKIRMLKPKYNIKDDTDQSGI